MMKSLTILLLLFPALVATYLSAQPKYPNIVLLYADDMGMGDLAIQNPDSKIPTPHLDQLAREGMLFSDAHSSASTCTPSRYSILSGNYHWRSFEGIANSFEESVFDEAELTLPEMLREIGYTTGCIGKWHLGFDWYEILNPGFEIPRGKEAVSPQAFDWDRKVPGGPTSHGFDNYFGDGTPNFPPYGWIENDKLVVAPTVIHEPSPIPEEGNHECRPGPGVEGWRLDAVLPRITKRAVEWIGERKDSKEPFFLYYAFTSPHTPIVPAREFVGSSEAGPYGDYMVQTDWSAGQILQALKDNGFADNTIVIFSSDNGSPGRLAVRYLDFGHNSSGSYRGFKTELYEGGHRVPFIVKWPGLVEPGSKSDALTSQIDIMATLAEFLGYTIPEGQAVDSVSMLPVLKQKLEKTRESLVQHTRNEQFGIRHDEWLLLRELNSRGENNWGKRHLEFFQRNNFPESSANIELYNLKDDPGQRTNLIDRYPEKVEALKVLLESIRGGN